MKQKPAISAVWERFVALLEADSPQMLEQIRAPTSAEAIAEAEQCLQIAFPEELRQLYLLVDGFAEGAYLLRDDLRILPLSEMVQASLALVGVPILMDSLALQVTVPKKVIHVIFADAEEDNPDIEQVSLRLRSKIKPPSVEIWFREGGIHKWEDIVETGDTLTEWFEECLEYYG